LLSDEIGALEKIWSLDEQLFSLKGNNVGNDISRVMLGVFWVPRLPSNLGEGASTAIGGFDPVCVPE